MPLFLKFLVESASLTMIYGYHICPSYLELFCCRPGVPLKMYDNRLEGEQKYKSGIKTSKVNYNIPLNSNYY